ncbi:threonine/serine exporter [Bombilactobacillus bombi]|uniref:Threonine/serine exporter n=1 Tax=Bombilactobacillus bombi TaxID=1303590 RepID=A0A417ZHN8_9LACO|nr:threonine/serine exporter family protein [Bombilactobacillus bombi]RHW51090.1 threonine/serine exporter [Bombilactobacillus bombi]
MEEQRIKKLLNTGILAGKIMMESGSEMYRVQDTLKRIMQKGGLSHPEIFLTPTGIFLSARDLDSTKMIEITHSSINLYKVSEVNTLSRQFSADEIDLQELYDGLEKVDSETLDFPLWLKAIAAFLISSTLMILFINRYDWFDFVQAGIVGMIGYLVFYYINNVVKIQFISEFIAAAMIAILAIGLRYFHLIDNLNYLIIGAVMPLVPGVALTNALRDLIAGHLISGVVRMVSGTLSALAIGGGIAVVLRFLL